MPVTPASLSRRLGAMLYDMFLLIALWTGTLWILVAVADTTVTGAWVQSLLFIEAFVFFAYFWMRNQQTLGMQAWHIRVQNADGSHITLRQCLLRFITGIPSLLLVGLGFWWMLVDQRRRSWTDLVSRSEIVFAAAHPAAAAHIARADQPQSRHDADQDGQQHRDRR